MNLAMPICLKPKPSTPGKDGELAADAFAGGFARFIEAFIGGEGSEDTLPRHAAQK